jgi:K+-transporting ATPase KdpF subunit
MPAGGRLLKRGRIVALEYILMGIVSLFVGIYLVVALLRPDRF